MLRGLGALFAHRTLALVVVAALPWPRQPMASQSVHRHDASATRCTFARPGFSFIKGEPLARLKDGRSVRVDLELEVLPRPGAAAAAQRRQTFVLSYDLWEERFAVTLADARRARCRT